MDSIFSCGFISCSKPTRVTRTAATPTDHCHTNYIASSTSSGIIINDVVGNFVILYTIKHGHNKTSDQFKNARFYNEYNIDKFK